MPLLEGKDIVMIFQIKKRIDSELFIDRTASHFIGEKGIRDMTYKGICMSK